MPLTSLRNSFTCSHWIAVGDVVDVRTVWTAHRDSCVPILRYCACIISRSRRESSLFVVFGCGTITGFVNVYDAWPTVVAPLSVPVGVPLQCTVNLRTSSLNAVWLSDTKYSGVPGGGVAPRSFAGSGVKDRWCWQGRRRPGASS